MGFAGIAVLLLWAPATLASGTTVTLKAPYKTATVVLTNSSSQSGCGAAMVLTPAYFNKTTGIGGFGDNATTSWCATSTNNSAVAQGQIKVTIPIHVTVTGVHNITATWLTVATGGVNLTAGKCTGSSSVTYSSCTRSARAFVYGKAFLIDKTLLKKKAPSNVWPGNFTYVSNYTSCTFTSCSSTASSKSSASLHTGNAFWFWAWNGGVLNATHKYVLQMFIFGGASLVLKVQGATLTGAKADAQLNTGTLGNFEQLYSITIT